MGNSNGNGTVTISADRLLPVSLDFEVAGTPLKAEYTVNDKGVGSYGHDCYFAVGNPAANREELLNELPITVLGIDLVPNEAKAHQSMPRLYGKGHDKAGQVIPGREGGNWTVKLIGAVDIAGRLFTVTCQVTVLDRDDERGVEARCSFKATERKLKAAREVVGTI